MLGPARETRVDGTRLAWTELGSGTPLVLLHGLGDSHRTWRRVAPRLAGHHEASERFTADLLAFLRDESAARPQILDAELFARWNAARAGAARPSFDEREGPTSSRGSTVRANLGPMYYETFGQMKKMLGQLDKWLEAAGEYAKTKSFDPNVFVTLRLAPDQFAFARQVQTACDTAKLGASRLTGKTPPSNPDTEQTLDELRARVRSTITYLESFSAKDFEGAAARTVTQPRWEGKVMTGADYFLEHVVPNFFFHVTHAFAILRHNGVNIGKRDYLGALSQRLP